MEEAKVELHRITRSAENQGIPVLVLANKQDLDGTHGGGQGGAPPDHAVSGEPGDPCAGSGQQTRPGRNAWRRPRWSSTGSRGQRRTRGSLCWFWPTNKTWTERMEEAKVELHRITRSAEN